MPARKLNAAFGQAIRQLRKEAGLTQEGLALNSALDRSYVGDVERGVQNAGLRNIMRIAAGLGVAPSELFTRFEEITRKSDEPD